MDVYFRSFLDYLKSQGATVTYKMALPDAPRRGEWVPAVDVTHKNAPGASMTLLDSDRIMMTESRGRNVCEQLKVPPDPRLAIVDPEREDPGMKNLLSHLGDYGVSTTSGPDGKTLTFVVKDRAVTVPRQDSNRNSVIDVCNALSLPYPKEINDLEPRSVDRRVLFGQIQERHPEAELKDLGENVTDLAEFVVTDALGTERRSMVGHASDTMTPSAAVRVCNELNLDFRPAVIGPNSLREQNYVLMGAEPLWGLMGSSIDNAYKLGYETTKAERQHGGAAGVEDSPLVFVRAAAAFVVERHHADRGADAQGRRLRQTQEERRAEPGLGGGDPERAPSEGAGHGQ
jgi:hypothetical protein